MSKSSAAQAARNLKRDLSVGLGKALNEKASSARSRVPVDTSRLKNSIKTGHQGTKGTIDVNTPYAIFQEMGTRYQPGREYLGLRSHTLGSDLIKTIKENIKR